MSPDFCWESCFILAEFLFFNFTPHLFRSSFFFALQSASFPYLNPPFFHLLEFIAVFLSSFWLKALALTGRDDSRHFQVVEINGKTDVQLLSTMFVQESMRKLISDSDHYTKQFQSHTNNPALNQIKGQFIRNWFSRMLESWRQNLLRDTQALALFLLLKDDIALLTLNWV